MRAKEELRSRLASVLALAVIVGVIGGVVIAAAAGARRTDTAYERLISASNALDVVADVHAKDPRVARRLLREVEHLPQVADASVVTITNGVFLVPGAKELAPIFPITSADGRFGTAINRIKILDGRMYDPKAPDEIVPSFTMADALHLHVGDTVRLAYGNPFGAFGEAP